MVGMVRASRSADRTMCNLARNGSSPRLTWPSIAKVRCSDCLVGSLEADISLRRKDSDERKIDNGRDHKQCGEQSNQKYKSVLPVEVLRLLHRRSWFHRKREVVRKERDDHRHGEQVFDAILD